MMSAWGFNPDQVEVDFWRELKEIEAESIGWIPLDSGAYLHVGDANATEVLVVGVPQAGDVVLLVG
jgi:hypothetical protein